MPQEWKHICKLIQNNLKVFGQLEQIYLHQKISFFGQTLVIHLGVTVQFGRTCTCVFTYNCGRKFNRITKYKWMYV
jgi:hypothetical protein